MINFDSQNGFQLEEQEIVALWLNEVVQMENHEVGELAYVFCSDAYLLDLNQRFLNHDTLTDIITFDYVENKILNGEVYISTDRIKENALDFGVSFTNELRRVMVHGILHLCGFQDQTPEDKTQMRNMEDKYLKIFQISED